MTDEESDNKLERESAAFFLKTHRYVSNEPPAPFSTSDNETEAMNIVGNETVTSNSESPHSRSPNSKSPNPSIHVINLESKSMHGKRRLPFLAALSISWSAHQSIRRSVGPWVADYKAHATHGNWPCCICLPIECKDTTIN